jgi:hypothetical protein
MIDFSHFIMKIFHIVLTFVNAGKTGWKDPTGSLNVLFKLFNTPVVIILYSVMNIVENWNIECYGSTR